MASNPQSAVDDARMIDATVKSIRSKVRSNRTGVAGEAKPESAVEISRLLEHIRQRLNRGQASVQIAVESPAAFSAKPQEILRLEIELEAALTAHRQVGQLNPRLPGFHNRAIQLLKKTLRRSLSWYTRPIQLFQAAVLRALQHVTAMLQSHGDSLQKMDSKLDKSMSACTEQLADMQCEVNALRSELSVVKEQLRKADTPSSEGGRQQL
jgi:hypothetical protein